MSAVNVWALDPRKALTQYVHDVWTTTEGLPQDEVSAIVQDSLGYIWFGTQEGLVRFDGVSFTVFDSHNTDAFRTSFIHGLFADSRGDLWVGASGLLRYRAGKFDFFGKENGLWPNADVKRFSEDAAGNLWLGYSTGSEKGSPHGLVKFKDEQGQIFTTKDGLSANPVKATISDKQGNLWIATANGLNLLRDGKFTHFTTADGLSDNFISALYVDRAGNLWVGTGNGLNLFKDDQFTLFTTKQGLANNYVRSLLEDRDGILWIGTESGLSRMVAGKIESFKGIEGLENDAILALLEDKEGSVWIGTDSFGLHRLRDGKFTVFGPPEGLLGTGVYAIFEAPDGRMLIGTNPGGLNVLGNGRVEAYSIANEQLSNRIRMIGQDKSGAFWIGTRDGINRFKDGRYQGHIFGAAMSQVFGRSFYEARDQTFWFGTDAGLKQVVGGKIIPHPQFEAYRAKTIVDILEDRSGRIWIGMNHGTGYFQGNAYTAYPAAPLSVSNVQDIHEDDDGVLWFATWGKGLMRLKGDKLTAFTSKDGLFDDVLWSVLDDGLGNLWMSSNRGIFRVSKQELDDFAEGRIKIVHSIVYGAADGMRKSETNQGKPSALRTRDGRLWFSTTAGAVVIDPRNIKTNQIPPPVVLEKVLVDEQAIASNAPLVIPPDARNVEFRYAGLSFIQPKRMKYKYKLAGYDTHWIEAETRRSAFYTNLPPGAYEFKVIAANSDGVWNEQGASFQFSATAPFWQRWWFIGLSLFVIAGAALLFYRRRVSMLEQEKLAQRRYSHQLIELQETERKRIAAELHDGLGQSLVIIKNRAALGLKKGDDQERAAREFNQISDAAAQALEEVREITNDLRPQLLDRAGLTKAIHSMFNKLAGVIEINRDIDELDGLFDDRAEISFYRIVQESLNNIVKHSNATLASVKIKRTDHQLLLIIEDNGTGFDPDKLPTTRSGMGLVGLKERAQLLNGEFSLHSETGKGTTIQVAIRLANNI